MSASEEHTPNTFRVSSPTLQLVSSFHLFTSSPFKIHFFSGDARSLPPWRALHRLLERTGTGVQQVS